MALMLLARLLAFLALLLLAPVAQAGTGDLSADHRLIDADALVEALSRKDERTTSEGEDKSEGWSARSGQVLSPVALLRIGPLSICMRGHASRLAAQPRAPPLRKV